MHLSLTVFFFSFLSFLKQVRMRYNLLCFPSSLRTYGGGPPFIHAGCHISFLVLSRSSVFRPLFFSFLFSVCPLDCVWVCFSLPLLHGIATNSSLLLFSLPLLRIGMIEKVCLKKKPPSFPSSSWLFFLLPLHSCNAKCTSQLASERAGSGGLFSCRHL